VSPEYSAAPTAAHGRRRTSAPPPACSGRSAPAGPTFLLLRNFAPLQFLAGDYRGRMPAEDRSLPWGFAVGLLANAIAGEIGGPPF
jgi:hypothetical protein